MQELSSKIRLLLVDDEEDFLRAAAKALSRRGFYVSTAPDAIAALELLEHRSFDVAVLDIKMPGMDGVQLFNEIRARWSKIAVIMLTGHATIQEAFSTSRDGVFDYLPKPCDFDQLSLLCRRAASGYREDEEEGSLEGREAIRVLLVDDEPDFLEAMTRVLSRRNMEVLSASSGNEALDVLVTSCPSVVVLDLRMPGMHGLEVLHRIKALKSEIEVVLLTGHPEVSLAFQGMKEGAFDFVVKPQDVDKLAELIRAAHRKHEANLEKREEARVARILREQSD